MSNNPEDPMPGHNVPGECPECGDVLDEDDTPLLRSRGISLTTVFPSAKDGQSHAPGWYLVGVMPGTFGYPNGHMAVFETVALAEGFITTLIRHGAP